LGGGGRYRIERAERVERRYIGDRGKKSREALRCHITPTYNLYLPVLDKR